MDASHQLRTPLTALSMRLEEMIAAAGDSQVVREEGAAALAQTERLADVVGQLLGRTRAPAAGAPALTTIDDIIAQQVDESDPAFRRRTASSRSPGERAVRLATPGALGQVVATLLDNALVHGAGTVTIRTSRTHKSVVVEVRDEGRGAAELVPRSSNAAQRPDGRHRARAWPSAGTMAAADGGKWSWSGPARRLAVFLPRGLRGPEEPPVVSELVLRSVITT